MFKLIHNSQGMMPKDSAQPGSGMHTRPWGQGCKISHLYWLCWIIKHKHLTQRFLSWPVSEVIEVTVYILTISVLMRLEAMLRISSLAPLERLQGASKWGKLRTCRKSWFFRNQSTTESLLNMLMWTQGKEMVQGLRVPAALFKIRSSRPLLIYIVNSEAELCETTYQNRPLG